LKDEIKMAESTKIDEHKLFEFYKDFYGIWNELDLSYQRDLICLIIKEINVNIPKGAKEGEIKITLWTNISQGVLSRQKLGSRFCKVLLRR